MYLIPRFLDDVTSNPRDEQPVHIRAHVAVDALLATHLVTHLLQCDGVRPKCLGCSELGFECTYVNSVSTSNVIVGKDYLSTLENRLQAVEEYIGCQKESQNESHGRRQQQLRFGNDRSQLGLCDTIMPNPSIASLANEELMVDSDSLQDSSDPGNDADGMGAMVFSTEQDCGFFGTNRSYPMPMSN